MKQADVPLWKNQLVNKKKRNLKKKSFFLIFILLMFDYEGFS